MLGTATEKMFLCAHGTMLRVQAYVGSDKNCSGKHTCWMYCNFSKEISLGSVVASALRKRFSMVAGVGRALSAPAIVEPANSPKSRACIGSLIPGCKDGIRNLDAAGMLRLFNGDSDS